MWTWDDSNTGVITIILFKFVAKDVALLVFHHKEAHALPSQTSDKILTGADFSGLGSIIDLAFLSQRGIYECDMNNVGIERVASFLLQYKTQRK